MPSFEVDRRFCGPPQSGNGGYVAGRLASFLEVNGAVAVRLFSPPALGKALEVLAIDGGVGLFDGETTVAQARTVELSIEPPTPPSFADARDAAKRFRGFEDRVFPGCFVCGFERQEGDGLRIFPGDTQADGLFAAPWTPDASLAVEDGGCVGPEFIWAALDCPGAFAFPQPEGKIILLGEMQVEILGDVELGEPCVLTSWKIGQSGRKHTTGSAIYGTDGTCRGVAQGVWIEIEPDAVPRD